MHREYLYVLICTAKLDFILKKAPHPRHAEDCLSAKWLLNFLEFLPIYSVAQKLIAEKKLFSLMNLPLMYGITLFFCASIFYSRSLKIPLKSTSQMSFFADRITWCKKRGKNEWKPSEKNKRGNKLLMI